MGIGICNEKNRNRKDQVQQPQGGSVPVKNITFSSKSLCRIFINYKEGTIGTGFFIDMFPSFKCLITNHHVIQTKMVESNTVIEILDDLGEKEKIVLDQNERYIRCFVEPTDITVVQIKKTDKIYNKFKSLKLDLNFQRGYQQYINNDIYILQYPKGNELESAGGKITDIDKRMEFKFYHNINTDGGSSGSPVLLTSNSRVIGVHWGSEDEETKENNGTFLGKIYEDIKEDIKKGLVKNIKILSNINNDNNDNNNNDNDRTNYIIAEIYIDSNNINKDVLIINSYEESKRRANAFILEENLKNEKDIKNCVIKINNKNINFSYVYNFNKVGGYTICYEFKNKLTICNYMFADCSLLASIDLSKLDTEEITNMRYMFSDCTSLINLNMSYLDIKNVIYMEGIFYGCTSLKKINLNKTETQKVKNLSWAFYNCSSLTEIKFTDFHTNNVEDMNSMFAG